MLRCANTLRNNALQQVTVIGYISFNDALIDDRSYRLKPAV